MKRVGALAVLAAALLVPVAAQASPRAATRDGHLVVAGAPFFPIMAWGQCPDTYGPLIGLGIDLFMGDCRALKGNGAELLAALDGRAYIALPASEYGVDGPGLIGWTLPDEPEGYQIAPDQLPLLPSAAETGKVRFLTVSNHFYSATVPIGGFGKELYPAYFSKADAIGFDLYPLAKFCGNQWIGLGDVYRAERELTTAHVPGKPTYEWIETGEMEGECLAAGALEAAVVRAEVWMAIAGGAAGIGYFTHTWAPGRDWRLFDVSPAVEAEIARTNAEIRNLDPVLLAPHVDASADGPVVAGARKLGDRVYVIAVNPTRERIVTRVVSPALGYRSVSTLAGAWVADADRGAIEDAFAPLAVHVYVASTAPEEPLEAAKPHGPRRT